MIPILSHPDNLIDMIINHMSALPREQHQRFLELVRVDPNDPNDPSELIVEVSSQCVMARRLLGSAP